MVTTSPISGVPTPQIGDNQNVTTSLGDIATYVDRLLVPRFSSVTERNSVIPSPEPGMMCYVSGTQEMYIFKRVPYYTWVSAAPRFYVKTADTNYTTTSYVNDPHLSFTVEAKSVYVGKLSVQINASSSVDAKTIWTAPSGTSIKNQAIYKVATGATSGEPSADSVIEWTTSAINMGTYVNASSVSSFNAYIYVATGSQSGTAQIQFACLVAGTLTVEDSSNMKIWKVA